MNRKHRPVLFGVLAALCVSLLSANASAATHPNLLFSRDDIPKIRANLDGPLLQMKQALEAGIHFPVVGYFPKTADLGYEYFGDPRAMSDSLMAFAFGAAVLDPSSQAGKEANELALNYLRGICGLGDWVMASYQDGSDPDLISAHFLFNVAVSYDWLYDRLSESDRQACRNRVAIEGEKMYRAATNNAWWTIEYLQNHNWINTASLGMAALAFDGEIPANTGAWLEAAKANMEKVQYVLDLIQGGTWHEGTGYLHYGFDSIIPFSMALTRTGKGPDYADNQVIRDYAMMRQQMMPPALAHRREYVLWGDFSGLQNENTLLPLYYAARKWKDGRAQWYAEQFIEGQTAGRDGLTSWPPGQRGMLLAAALYDASVPVEPPTRVGAAWELDYYAHDLSLFTARSGWEDGGNLVALKSGVFGGWGNFERMSTNGWPGGSINFGHDHADDMGVYFFADGEWLTTRVPGYYIGRDNGQIQVNRTQYANSLLVNGNGQLGEGVRNCWMGSCPWFFSRQGSIPIRGSTSNFSYALGAGSGLYDPSLGMTGFGRSVLHVDRRFPVVRDVIRGTTPQTWEIVWHGMDGATRDGDWLRLTAKNDRALGVKVVAPAAFETRTENQSAVHLDKFDPDGSMSAIMVRPSAREKDAVFLSALVPARGSSWGSKPTVEAIDAQAPDRGLVIKDLPDGESYEVVFSDAPELTSEAAGISVTGMAGVKKVRGGKIEKAMLAAGTHLSLDGIDWIAITQGGRGSIEVEVTDKGVAISGDERGLRVYAPGATTVTYNGKAVKFARDGSHVVYPTAGEPVGGGDGGGSTPGECPGDNIPVETPSVPGTEDPGTGEPGAPTDEVPGTPDVDVEGGQCDGGGTTPPTQPAPGTKKGKAGCSAASGAEAAGLLGFGAVAWALRRRHRAR